jgi:hypothetical protein
MMKKMMCCGAAVLLFLAAGCGKKSVFNQASDVGNCKLSGGFVYDADQDVYTLTGAGTNMWGTADEFFMAWTELEGDFRISAHVRFEGDGVNAHRKMGLIVRESLDGDARYADVAVHGDGLTSLQYRQEKGAITQEIKAPVQNATHVVLERRGNVIVARSDVLQFPSDEYGATIEMALPARCYVGLFVCSHEADVLEAGYFSDVRVERLR